MKSIHLKLSADLLSRIDKMIEEGDIKDRGAFINEAIKTFLFYQKLGKQIGSIPQTGDSVKEVRAIRKRLSREDPEAKSLEA